MKPAGRMTPKRFRPRVVSLYRLRELQTPMQRQEDAAEAAGLARATINRNEQPDALLAKMSVATLQKHLAGLGYDLALVAVPAREEARQEVFWVIDETDYETVKKNNGK